MCFTFQSGYIQIMTLEEAIDHALTLHSNLVIFKSIQSLLKSRFLRSLHSNLVIFKFSL